MALTTDEKQRVRYHLGYPLVSTDQSLRYGMVVPVEFAYLVDDVVDSHLSAAGESKVRQLLGVLDGIETKLICAQGRLAVQSVDEIEMRTGMSGESEPDLLEREYRRWQGRLGDTLGCPVNQHSTSTSGKRINVSVRS